jgi:serine/threonine protein kinase
MTEPVSRLQGALADRYRIERELGQGGMATVSLAEDLKHQRSYLVSARLGGILSKRKPPCPTIDREG